MGERGVMGVGGVMVNVGRTRVRRGCLVLVSAAGVMEPVGTRVGGDEEGTMMRRSGTRLFALEGS